MISQGLVCHLCLLINKAKKKSNQVSYLVSIHLIFPIKRRSKVQEKNKSCESVLNIDQWKTFSENYKPMRVWLLPPATFFRGHSNSKEVSFIS